MAGTDQTDEHDGPPRSIFIAALVVAVGAIAAVIGVAALRTPLREPVAIPSVPAPMAADPACAALLGALPAQLGDYQRATAADPVPAGAAAWQADSGGEPVILRCGLDRPGDFVVGTPLQVVDQVQWFQVAEAGGGDQRSTWFAVDRPVYVVLTLPAGSGPTPIQELSETIAKVMPATAIRPGPPG
jgi:hypothetical protein